MIRLLFIVIGYLFGMFQTGHFYGKLVNVDLHKCGSGNAGATNALRVMGLKGGLIVFFFDCMKAFIPCFTVRMIFRGQPMDGMEKRTAIALSEMAMMMDATET